MADFTMPKLGADMHHGLLSEWLVEPGSIVKRGDIVAVVETDKGAIEVEIFEDGTVDELLVAAGEEAPVGAVLARLRSTGTPVVEAEPVAKPEPVAEPERAARSHRVAAADTPTVAKAKPPPVDHRPVQRRPVDHRTAEVAMPTGPPRTGRVRAAPAARHLAHSLGIELSAVTGTGPHGAVTTRDIRALVAAGGGRRAEVPPAPTPPATVSAAPVSTAPVSTAPVSTGSSGASRFDPGAMRQAIAAAMSRSNREIPHYYLAHDVDLSAATAWLAARNADRPLADRLHLSALLARAVTKALGKVPELNGSWQDGGLQASAAVHLGFAISLRGGGLVAPALLDAQDLDVEQLQARIGDLVERARAGRLTGREMASPTVTLTSLGDLGVDVVHGVITPPQVALVGCGRPRDRVVAVDGMVAVRPVITVTLAADHRASDGARGARFLSLVERYLTKPEKL